MKASLEKIIALEKSLEKQVEGNTQNISLFQEEFLKKIIEILNVVEEVFEGRGNKKTLDYKLKILKKYQYIIGKKQDIKDVDELIDICLKGIEKQISVESIKLNYDIFPAQTGTTIKKGEGSFEKGKKTTDKYKQILQLFIAKGINFNDIVVFEEEIDKKRMRKNPYRIIYIQQKDIEKTILVSDEIGQATYIYDGILDVKFFKDNKKGETVDGIGAIKIVYSDQYKQAVEKNIFSELKEKTKQEKQFNISSEILKNSSLKDIVQWRIFIESKGEILRDDANIFFQEGIWYFGDAKSYNHWGYLKRFPNVEFNRKHNITGERGEILNPQELKKMFGILGFRVASEEEEKIRWSKILEGYRKQFSEEANIYLEDNIWYFGDAKGSVRWKNLRDFPKASFNKENGIGDKKRGRIGNVGELKKMFQILGLRVADEKQELERLYKIEENILKPKWRATILGYKNRLKKEANIYLEGDKWYFGNMKNSDYWTYLLHFPNAGFNKKYDIGNKEGAIRASSDLKKLFLILGFNIATKEEEKERSDKTIKSP